jgi:hypothetical protein
MKHIPTPRDTSNNEIKESIKQFMNKTGWKYFFYRQNADSIQTNEFDTTFKTIGKEFHFSKPYDTILSLKYSLDDISNNYVKNFPCKKRYNNILPLKKFVNEHPDIKFVLSDKNLGLVALDLNVYHKLVMENLYKRQYEYIEPKGPLYFSKHGTITSSKFQLLITKIINKTTDTNIIKYLKACRVAEYMTPQFHILIKLHKGLQKLQSRPIVGAVNWYTTPISKILSKNLRTLFQTEMNTKHLANNTFDIVQSIGDFNLFLFKPDTSYLLVSLDVVNLYTNIDLKILYDTLETINPDYKEMAQFVCNHNYFSYADEIFKQTNGIAMGTNCAPELANFYLLAYIDPAIVINPNIPLFKRFLDDIFFIWSNTEEELMKFLTKIDEAGHILNLTFTKDISRYQTNFLDLTILLKRQGLEHYTHQKKLNKYGYISPKSSHPKHTLSGFIKGELTRYGLNSSQKYYYQITKTLFYHRLLARGYQRPFLNRIFQKHRYREWMRSKIPPNPISTNLSLRFSTRNNLQRLKKNIKKIGTVKSKHFIPGHELQFSWKKSPNLISILCKSGLTLKQIDIVKHERPSGTTLLKE